MSSLQKQKTSKFRNWKFIGRDFLHELERLAVNDLWILLLCICAAAMVTILEASFHMKMVIQSDAMVPGFASALIVRELGVVVMALLITARAGAGMAAEIASMKTTDQILALKALGFEERLLIYVPRLAAGVVGCLLLALIASVVCLAAAMAVSVFKLGYTPQDYLNMSRPFVGGADLFVACVKGAAFGFVIPMMACKFGLRAQIGAAGVGQATTNAVVAGSISVIFLDFLLTVLFTQIGLLR